MGKRSGQTAARRECFADHATDSPIGAAAYNNEFGRPNLNGYFRTLEMLTPDGRNRGYRSKPIMIAGGYGNIRTQHVDKMAAVTVGARLVVLGGPAMLIGLGGAAGSSMATGAQTADLDFASVQRANPELERRCQEVVDACWALRRQESRILSIHDVGAGGISNALPELVHADDRGGHFKLRDVQSADPARCRRWKSGAMNRKSATFSRLRQKASLCWNKPVHANVARSLRRRHGNS